MPTTQSKGDLSTTINVLADEAWKALVKVGTSINHAVQVVLSTGAMKVVARASAQVFKVTLVEAAMGLTDGIRNFTQLGYHPIARASKVVDFYKKENNFNPIYVLSNAAGAIVITPLAASARVVVGLNLGLLEGTLDAFNTKASVRESLKESVKNGSYFKIPTYLLAYVIAKPLDFTARQLKDGTQLGWNVDFKGFQTLIAQEPNLAKRIPLTVVSSIGFALGLSAKGIKYPVESLLGGFGDGLGVMVKYTWFHKQNFFVNRLYKKSTSNVLYNFGMVPGAIVGLALGEVSSTIVGVFYGLGNGVQAAADFKQITKPLNVLSDVNSHQMILMAPALWSYAAGTAVGFTASLITKPIHSLENFKTTATCIAIPFVAPIHYGRKLFSRRADTEQAFAIDVQNLLVTTADIDTIRDNSETSGVRSPLLRLPRTVSTNSVVSVASETTSPTSIASSTWTISPIRSTPAL